MPCELATAPWYFSTQFGHYSPSMGKIQYLWLHDTFILTLRAKTIKPTFLQLFPNTHTHTHTHTQRQEYWSGVPFPSPVHESESESEVAQSCPTLCDPMDCSLPGFSIHGISQARVLERGAIAFSGRGL